MTLLERTAEALYLTATCDVEDPVPYEKLSKRMKDDFERMAVAALTIAYREPVLSDA